MKKHRNIPKEAEILRDKRLEMSLTQMDVALEAKYLITDEGMRYDTI